MSEHELLRSDSELVYNIIDVAVDRFMKYRQEDQDLYFIDHKTGEFKLFAEAFNDKIIEESKKLLNRKLTQFFVTFSGTFNMEEGLTPMALKIVRYFARKMNYSNIVTGVGYDDMEKALKTQSRYIAPSLKLLLEKDIIRFKVEKNQRTYMVNPIYYYRGRLWRLYTSMHVYKHYPRNEGKETIKTQIEL